MKTNSLFPSPARCVSLARVNKFLVLAMSMGLILSQSAQAASATWTGTTGNWTDTTWSTGSAPGAPSGTITSPDTATFNTSGGGTITVDSARNIENITFDTTAGAFTLSGGSLALTSGGTLQLASTMTSTGKTETIGTPISLEGSYAFTNNAGNSSTDYLDFTSATTISTGVSGTSTLTLGGTNTESGSSGTTGGSRIDGVISNGTGTLAVVKNGAGTWRLNGTNTYSGGTTLNAGTLALTSDGSVGTGTFTINGGTIEGITASSTLTNSADVLAGNFSVATFSGGVNFGTASVTLSPTSGSTISIDIASGQTLTANNVSDSSLNYGVIKTDTGALALGGTGTYTGGTTINGGSLNLNTATALASTGALTVNNPNTGAGTTVQVNFFAGATTIGSLSGATATPSSGTNTNKLLISSGYTLTVNQTTNGTYDGTISGGASGFTLGSLSTATLTLSGASTYTGATSVNAGALNVTGSLGSGSAVGVTGGTLEGTGTIAGTVHINSGGILSAGIAGSGGTIGTLNTGALTMLSTGTLKLNLNSTTRATDFISVTGALTLGNATLSASDEGSTSLAAGTVFDILNYTGALSGTFAGLADGSDLTIGSNMYEINYGTLDANEITLDALAVPEPSTWAMLLGGVVMLAFWQRRRGAAVA